MSDSDSYAIGDSRVPWGIAEKAAWRAVQKKQRSYSELVELRVQALMEHYDVTQYGKLSYHSDEYALHALSSKNWNPELPNILVTGGVHGYETSGVMGTLSFLETACEAYQGAFNFLVIPCISPWAFETINRWNPLAIDPNRSFVANSPAGESAAVMDWLSRRGRDFLGHFDLHETTDTDNSEFRPALAARDAKPQDHWDIPDGFYGVADSSRPSPEFQRAIIESVARVTHIAPSIDGRIIGETLQQEGVICYDGKGLGLCMGVTDAPYVTTTEVYPDSPLVTDDDCVAAQVAAVTGGLEYLLSV